MITGYTRKTACISCYFALQSNFSTHSVWQNLDYTREYLQKLKEQYNTKDNEWHLITTKQILDYKGRGLLWQYKTFHNALQAAYPNIRTEIKPKQDWRDLNYVRSYLQRLRSHYNISEDEWHIITTKQIVDFGGKGLIGQYKTFHKAVQAAYPDIKIQSRQQDWKDLNYVREYLQKLRSHYHLSEDEWHLVTAKQVVNFNGGGLLLRYKTFRKALQAAYPEIQIRTRSLHDWKNHEYVKDYLEKLRNHYQKTEDEWNTISRQQIFDFDGKGLIKRYGTLHNALCSVNSDYQASAPSSQYWNNTDNVVHFIKSVEKQLHMKDPHDWYRVSPVILRQLGGQGLCTHTRRFISILQTCYPNITWDKKLLSTTKKKSEQFFLRSFLIQLYPDVEILEDYLHPGLTFSSGIPIELDLYIPDRRIAFEYHGVQHYQDTPYFGPVEMYQQRDSEKLEKCAKIDIRLVAIPYSWGRTLQDLSSRISGISDAKQYTNMDNQSPVSQ